jgi:hypothetical protein
MRRRATVAGVALVLLSVLIVPASAAAGPNDTMAGAEGPVTGSFTAAIDTVNDVDWYFIYAQASTQLDVAISGLGPEYSCQDWDLALRNSEGRELESVHAGFNQVRHILYTLQTAGTYYLEVTGFYCEAVGYYRIDLAASPALLTSPPYVPPLAASQSPSGSPGGSPGCRTARRRIASLSSRLRHITNRRQRNRLRVKLRQARSTAASLC